MNWVDIVVLTIVAISTMNGLRRGAALQLFSYGGFWGGLFLGAALTPVVASHIHSSAGKAVVAIFLVLGFAFVLGTVGSLVGVRSGAALRRIKLGPLDSGLGVGVAVIATLLVVWLAGSLIGASSFTSLASAMQNSRIVRALDNVLPQPPSVFAKVETFLGNEGFPLVFSGLPPAIAGFVPLPATSVVNQAADAAAPSTVKIEGQACGLTQEGSGFVVAPGLVVTNAHVVAGVGQPFVIDDKGYHPAIHGRLRPGARHSGAPRARSRRTRPLSPRQRSRRTRSERRGPRLSGRRSASGTEPAGCHGRVPGNGLGHLRQRRDHPLHLRDRCGGASR